METHSLQALSIPSFVHDALIVAGVGIALLAGLAFIRRGLLRPGLLTALGGRHGDPRGGCVAFGPFVAPLISEPASRRVPSLEPTPDPQMVVRPHRWPDVSESAVSHSASVRTVMVWTVGR